MRLAGILALGVSALVIACAGMDQSLADTSWTLVALGPVSAPQPALEGHAATLSFSGDGRRIAGSTGCNSYRGNYRADRESFTVTELSWTEAGCPAPGLFEQESAMTDILAGARRYSSGASRLTIESADGRVLVFVR